MGKDESEKVGLIFMYGNMGGYKIMGLILPQDVEVFLTSQNIDRYKKLGYKIEKRIDKYGNLHVARGTRINIHVLDLPLNSRAKVKLQCDCCGKIKITSYANYIKVIKKHNGLYICNCYGSYSTIDEFKNELLFFYNKYNRIPTNKDIIIGKDFKCSERVYSNILKDKNLSIRQFCAELFDVKYQWHDIKKYDTYINILKLNINNNNFTKKMIEDICFNNKLPCVSWFITNNPDETVIHFYDFIKWMGYENLYSKHIGFGVNYEYDDGEKTYSQYEYQLSNYLRKIGLKYNTDYYRSVKYIDFTNNYKGNMNCDYLIQYHDKKIYVEVAGMLLNNANKYKNNIVIPDLKTEKYGIKLRLKEKLFKDNNIKYIILFPYEKDLSKLDIHKIEDLFDIRQEYHKIAM